MICSRCGSTLEIEGDHYVCPYCDAIYTQEDQKEAEKALRTIIAEAKEEALANRRRVMWDAAHANNISTLKLFRAASSTREIFAEDLLANFYLAALSDDPAELNAFLLSANWDESNAREAVRFCLLSLESRNVLALRSFVENTFVGKEAETYLEKISEEAVRLDEGVYLTSLPRDVFLAYSSADMDKVVEIADELEASGLKVFVAARNLRHGKGAQENYERAIFDAMRHCRCVVFLSSEASRSLSCDALKIELPFANDNLPRTGKIEYLIEPYGKQTKPAATIILKNSFKGKEWCTNKEDLLARILTYTTNSDKICLHCGEINDANARHCHQCGYPLDKNEYEARVLEEKRKEEDKVNLEKERERLRQEAGSIAEEAVKKLRQEIEAASNSCCLYVTSIVPGREIYVAAHIARLFDNVHFAGVQRELQSLPAVFPSPISKTILSYEEACLLAFRLEQEGATIDVRETRTGKMLRTYEADVSRVLHSLTIDEIDKTHDKWEQIQALQEAIGCEAKQAEELLRWPNSVIIKNMSYDGAVAIMHYLNASGINAYLSDMPRDEAVDQEIARKIAEEEAKIKRLLEEAKKRKEAEPEKPKSFSLILEKAGKSKIEIIKVILQFTGMSLLPAKQLVDNAPSTIRTDLEENKANIFKEALEKAGATAKVEPTKE